MGDPPAAVASCLADSLEGWREVVGRGGGEGTQEAETGVGVAALYRAHRLVLKPGEELLRRDQPHYHISLGYYDGPHAGIRRCASKRPHATPGSSGCAAMKRPEAVFRGAATLGSYPDGIGASLCQSAWGVAGSDHEGGQGGGSGQSSGADPGAWAEGQGARDRSGSGAHAHAWGRRRGGGAGRSSCWLTRQSLLRKRLSGSARDSYR